MRTYTALSLLFLLAGACEVAGPPDPPNGVEPPDIPAQPGPPTSPPQCTEWPKCPSPLLVHSRIVSDGSLTYGDSFIVMWSVQNTSTLATDLLEIGVGGVSVGGKSRRTRINAGQTVEFIDTLYVSGFTFGQPAELLYWANPPVTYRKIEMLVTGDRMMPVVASGYKLALVAAPPTRNVEFFGRTFAGWIIRENTPVDFVVQVDNPYPARLPQITVGVCAYTSYEFCYARNETRTSETLASGRSTHASFQLRISRGSDWWVRDVTRVSVCGEQADAQYGHECSIYPALLLPNLEAACTVSPISVATPITDAAPECGKEANGSVYRFTARAGEQYRVELLAGLPNMRVMIMGADGIAPEEIDPSPHEELVIAQDGAYYVVVLHSSPASFRLVRF